MVSLVTVDMYSSAVSKNTMGIACMLLYGTHKDKFFEDNFNDIFIPET